MRVSYIALQVGWPSILLTSNGTSDNTKVPVVKFALPVNGKANNYNPKWANSDPTKFVTPGEEIHDFLVKNHADSPYEIILITEIGGFPKMETVICYSIDSESKYFRNIAHSIPAGLVLFRRKDGELMSTVEYVSLYKAMYNGIVNINNHRCYKDLPKISTLKKIDTGSDLVLVVDCK